MLPWLSWEDPIKSGALFFVGLGLFFVFGIAKVSITSFVVYAFVAVAVVTGALAALTSTGVLQAKFSVAWLSDFKGLDALPRTLVSCAHLDVQGFA